MYLIYLYLLVLTLHIYIYLFDQLHYHNYIKYYIIYIFNLLTTNFNPYFFYKNIIIVR